MQTYPLRADARCKKGWRWEDPSRLQLGRPYMEFLTLPEVSRSLPNDVHVVLVLDRAGWHGAKALKVPGNLTLVPLPPYSPELNPIERVWLYLRERFLSLRVFKDYRAIIDACSAAWSRLVAEPGRIHFLCHQPWIRKVTS